MTDESTSRVLIVVTRGMLEGVLLRAKPSAKARKGTPSGANESTKGTRGLCFSEFLEVPKTKYKASEVGTIRTVQTL